MARTIHLLSSIAGSRQIASLNSYHGCSFIFSESQGQTSRDSHQRELHRVIFRCSRLDVRWEWDNERGEPEVKRDPSFLRVV